MHALAGGFQDRAQEGDGRALAVGAGDMDDRRQLALGMIERGQQTLARDRATDRCAWDAARSAARRWSRSTGGPIEGPVAAGAHADAPDRCAVRRGVPRQWVCPGGGRRLGDGRQTQDPTQRPRATDGGARPCRPCRAPSGIRRAESLRAVSRGWSARSRAGRQSRSARPARRLDVAQHRVGGGDAAGGRIGQHDDVGLLRFAQRCTAATVVRGSCISERMPSCMRAPPEAANMMNGVPCADRGCRGP